MSFSGADSMRKNVPTPHFGRRPGVDKIDELIEDTDKALKGLPTLPSRLPPTGPDPKALKRGARAGGGLVTRHACL